MRNQFSIFSASWLEAPGVESAAAALDLDQLRIGRVAEASDDGLAFHGVGTDLSGSF